MSAEHLRPVPLLDTLERVIDHSIIVDGHLIPPQPASGTTPPEWIDAAGETFVITYLQVRLTTPRSRLRG